MSEPQAAKPDYVEPPTPPPAKKGFSLGCKITLIIAAVLFAIFVVLAVSVVRFVMWANHRVAAPYTFPATVLTPEEQKEDQEFRQKADTAKKSKTTFEMTLSLNTLNKLFEEGIAENIKKGKLETMPFEVVHFSTVNNRLVIMASHKTPEGYVNYEVHGDISLENKRVDMKLDSISSNGEEAPWLGQYVARYMIDKTTEGLNHGEGDQSVFKQFQLVKREGDKVHVIIAPAEFPEDK